VRIMYQVQKKNGSSVDFDRNKIVTGILKAGGTQENAQKIAADVEVWLPTIIVNNVVKFSDLRGKVIGELRTVNPTAAANFESYRKT